MPQCAQLFMMLGSIGGLTNPASRISAGQSASNADSGRCLLLCCHLHTDYPALRFPGDVESADADHRLPSWTRLHALIPKLRDNALALGVLFVEIYLLTSSISF
jgi:hypothetical protein